MQLEREDGDEILVGVARRARARRSRRGRVRASTRASTPATRPSSRVRRGRRARCVYRRRGALPARQLHLSPRRRCAIRVVEVVPPHPPKLLDMARTVLEYDEDLPPIELDFVPIDLRELATAHPAEHYLFPCRCAGLDLDARVDFLDAGPPAAADWTLVGCERSRQIHAALYGHEPHARVDFCPLLREREPRPEPTLLKCCLRERGIEREDARMIVPWGANLEEVRAGAARARGWRRERHRPRRLGHLRPPVGDARRRARCSPTRAARARGSRSSRRSPRCRASSGIIPAGAAARARRGCERVDLEAVGEETRATGHSTLGLIRVLRRELGPEARRVDLLRRDRPGRHRHLVRARDAADARDRSGASCGAIEAALLDHARRTATR